jgi:hypothetical protein
VLAVARGFERDEARETLLHEAMHGLFYTCAPFEAACWSFWRTSLSEAQRELWRAFLGGLGYDGDNEELAVNEFQVSYRVSYHRTRIARGGAVVGPQEPRIATGKMAVPPSL